MNKVRWRERAGQPVLGRDASRSPTPDKSARTTHTNNYNTDMFDQVRTCSNETSSKIRDHIEIQSINR